MSGLLADLMLLLHIGVVLFVVGGQALILLGAALGWQWIGARPFRYTHLALIGFIVIQTWLGQLCPLTVWEQALRQHAGQATYHESFVEHWLSSLLYVEAPWWAFLVAYSAFFLLVLLSWWRWPPRRRAS